MPTGEHEFPVVHGPGPVGLEVAYRLSVDGAGHGAGHFELLRSWLPPGWLRTRGFPAVAIGRERAPPQGQKRTPPESDDEDDCDADGPEEAPAAAETFAKATALHKKPARKRTGNPTRKGHTCPCEGCCFSTNAPGKAARLLKQSLGTCVFCSRDNCLKALATARGRGALTRSLKRFYSFKDNKPDVLDAALARLEQWAPGQVEEFRQKAAIAKRSKPQANRAEARRQKEKAAAKQWKICMGWRQPALRLTNEKALKSYRAAVLADQRWATKNFYPDAPRRPRAAGEDLASIVDNECTLPPAFTSEEAIGLQCWCQKGAWGMCPQPDCRLLQARHLTQKDLDAPAGPLIAPSACRRCRAKRQYMVPRPEDVPEKLRDLDPEVLAALRPLDLDVGPEKRSGTGGYRTKVRMTTFSWSLEPVETKIRALQSKEARRRAKKAFKYLLSLGNDNEYKDYHSRHHKFLAKHRYAPTPHQAKRPLHFIEEPGLETAHWPHLYWKTSMCESFERLNARRLQQLEGKKAGDKGERAPSEDSSGEEDALSSSDDEDEEQQPQEKQCIKRSFQTKLLSPLLGYGADFELLQYVFDLHLWTDLGSKRNCAGDTKMRFMMKGHSMSPLYWDDVKFGLFDLVRQLGYPDIYWTLAPWEPSFPYHHFMLDEMQKLHCVPWQGVAAAAARSYAFSVPLPGACAGIPGGQACVAASSPVGTPLGQPRAARASVWSSIWSDRGSSSRICSSRGGPGITGKRLRV